jgi:hypothetical protein
MKQTDAMELIVEYKDDETAQPKVIMKGGKIVKIIIDAPFVLTDRPEKKKKNGLNVRSITVHVGQTMRCSYCKQEKLREQYHNSTSNRVGLDNNCMRCKALLSQESRRRKLEEEDEARRNEVE